MTSYRIVDDENYRVVNVLREMEKFQRVGQNMLHESGIIRVNHNDQLIFYYNIYSLLTIYLITNPIYLVYLLAILFLNVKNKYFEMLIANIVLLFYSTCDQNVL